MYKKYKLMQDWQQYNSFSQESLIQFNLQKFQQEHKKGQRDVCGQSYTALNVHSTPSNRNSWK